MELLPKAGPFYARAVPDAYHPATLVEARRRALAEIVVSGVTAVPDNDAPYFIARDFEARFIKKYGFHIRANTKIPGNRFDADVHGSAYVRGLQDYAAAWRLKWHESTIVLAVHAWFNVWKIELLATRADRERVESELKELGYTVFVRGMPSATGTKFEICISPDHFCEE